MVIGSIARILLVIALGLAGNAGASEDVKAGETAAASAHHRHKHQHAAAGVAPHPAAAKPAPKPQVQPVIAAKPAEPAANSKPADARPADVRPAAHFVSLRADKVYLRSGPGAEYPIQWVYVRKGLPVEVLANFDIWRKIRDQDGVEGWVHQGMLTAKRSAVVVGAVRNLRSDSAPDAAVVAQLEPGVIASVSKCDAAWCEVSAGGYEGWMARGELWGFEPGELIQ